MCGELVGVGLCAGAPQGDGRDAGDVDVLCVGSVDGCEDVGDGAGDCGRGHEPAVGDGEAVVGAQAPGCGCRQDGGRGDVAGVVVLDHGDDGGCFLDARVVGEAGEHGVLAFDGCPGGFGEAVGELAGGQGCGGQACHAGHRGGGVGEDG